MPLPTATRIEAKKGPVIMSRKNRINMLFALLLLTATTMLGALPLQTSAAATPRAAVRLSGGAKCFQPTGKCMHGIFLGYWQARSGINQFGYPITDQLVEDGRAVQYTERARFEWH